MYTPVHMWPRAVSEPTWRAPHRLGSSFPAGLESGKPVARRLLHGTSRSGPSPGATFWLLRAVCPGPVWPDTPLSLAGKPELPRQPGSTTQYDAEAGSPDTEHTESDSPQSGPDTSHSVHTLDGHGRQRCTCPDRASQHLKARSPCRRTRLPTSAAPEHTSGL